VLRAKYIAGVSVGASSPGGKYADLAPYWAFVEFGTGLRGLFTQVDKPIGNPSNWRYGFINGQTTKAYIRRGLKSFLNKAKSGRLQ